MNSQRNVLCSFCDLSCTQFSISFEQPEKPKNTYIFSQLYSVGQPVGKKKTPYGTLETYILYQVCIF